jgi:hypothetical protein
MTSGPVNLLPLVRGYLIARFSSTIEKHLFGPPVPASGTWPTAGAASDFAEAGW